MNTYREKLNRFTEHGLDEQETSSPMDPPPAYDLKKPLEIPFDEFAKPLQELLSDHEKYVQSMEAFEKALTKFKDSQFQITPELSRCMSAFFKLVDEDMEEHHRKEEKHLFPVLRKRLIEAGECSPGVKGRTVTPCEIMESDHRSLLVSVNLVMNLIGIGSKLPDPKSRYVVFHYAFEQAKEMIEELRLHIFKENQVLFPLAQKLLTEEEKKSLAS